MNPNKNKRNEPFTWEILWRSFWRSLEILRLYCLYCLYSLRCVPPKPSTTVLTFSRGPFSVTHCQQWRTISTTQSPCKLPVSSDHQMSKVLRWCSCVCVGKFAGACTPGCSRNPAFSGIMIAWGNWGCGQVCFCKPCSDPSSCTWGGALIGWLN